MSNHVQTQGRTGPVGVGLIGAGMISDTYLTNLTRFPDVRVLIVGDINPVRAEAQAKAHQVERWGTPDDVLAHPDVELIVNLTIPAAHIEVATAAIDAGKHVWTEKPLASIARAPGPSSTRLHARVCSWASPLTPRTVRDSRPLGASSSAATSARRCRPRR